MFLPVMLKFADALEQMSSVGSSSLTSE
jgi:hypothetical protein